MLDERFVYATLLLNLVGAAHYLVMIFRGHVQPNRASWALWAIAPGVVFAAELAEGVGIRTVMTFGITLDRLLVVVASYATKAAYWKLGALDYACADCPAWPWQDGRSRTLRSLRSSSASRRTHRQPSRQ